MQKKFIALAVAALASGAAFAQSNVTVYGVADAGYVHASGNGIKANAIESGVLAGSRLGFKGEEALGNGLKAVFTLEYALSLDGNVGVGTGALAARQQFVGLAGGFGTVTLGRQYAPGYAAAVRNDAVVGSITSAHAVLTAASGSTIAPNSNARWNNAVAYASNTYSGFSAKAIYGFGQTSEVSTPNVNDPRYGLGLNYANGPLNADFVYQNQENVAGDDKAEWYLGGSYNLGVAKLLASYQKLNDKSVANADNKVWQLGAVVPVTAAGNVHLTYGQLDWTGANNTSKSFTLAYTHALSKRTTLYAAWNNTNNDQAGSAAGVVAGVAALDKKNNTIGAGINHSF